MRQGLAFLRQNYEISWWWSLQHSIPRPSEFSLLILSLPYKNSTLEHLQQCSVCNPAKHISHIQVLVTYSLFSTPPLKLKLGLQIGGRLLTATHLDQSNYLANEKQRAASRYDLTVFIRLFQGSSRCEFLQGHSSLQWIPWIWLPAPHPRFCISSKISSAGKHSECRWRCSYTPCASVFHGCSPNNKRNVRGACDKKIAT